MGGSPSRSRGADECLSLEDLRLLQVSLKSDKDKDIAVFLCALKAQLRLTGKNAFLSRLQHVASNVAKSAENFGRALIQAAIDGKTAEVERIVLSANATVVNFAVNFADADRGDLTPLFCASGNGHEEVVTLLLLHGADPNAKGNNGTTALMGASSKGYNEVAALLLQHGADPNAKRDSGETPLMCASHNGRKQLVSLLLLHGADPNATDNVGDTALKLAQMRGHKEVECMLKNALKQGERTQKEEALRLSVRKADQNVPNRPRTFYHATNLKAALAIQDAGFRVPNGSGGCLGPGIYCTTTLMKAFDYLKCKHGGIIFELNVDLGRCKILHPDDPQMKTWQQDYDSAWHPIGAVNNVEEGKEENCVKDPRRIEIVRPIAGHTGKLLAAGYDIAGDRLVRR